MLEPVTKQTKQQQQKSRFLSTDNIAKPRESEAKQSNLIVCAHVKGN